MKAAIDRGDSAVDEARVARTAVTRQPRLVSLAMR